MRFLPSHHGERRNCATRASRFRRLPVLLASFVAAAACGGATGTAAESPEGAAAGEQQTPEDITSTRTGAGIAAAGGDLGAFGATACDVNRSIRIAYVGPDLSELPAIGLGSLVIEEPAAIIAAYLTEVNANGGIAGRCVQSSIHLWSWANPAESFNRVCAEVPAAEPIAVLSLFSDVRAVQCLAIDAHLPTIGLYASVPATVQRRSHGRLFLDDGTVGHLLANSIEVARHAHIFSVGAKVGLLHGSPVGASPSDLDYNIGADFDEVVSLTGDHNLIPGVITHVPSEFGQLALLGAEERARLLESGLSAAEVSEASSELASMPAEQVSLLGQIERFYLEASATHRDGGVEVIVATAPWFELRRMMRAAERIGWHPRWIASDIQGATLTLTGAPEAQAANFFLISARRAAGDEIAELDRGCAALRSSAPGRPPFGHRHHTDAWSVLMATCDALDLTMSALSRIAGPMSAEAFLDRLQQTHYETSFGGHIGFGPGEYSGADRFRALRADPDCVLDEWGCMRAVSDWFQLYHVMSKDDGEHDHG